MAILEVKEVDIVVVEVENAFGPLFRISTKCRMHLWCINLYK